MQKTGLVIPCYNEAARLNPAAFQEVLAANAELSFVFVNDGSTDETLRVLREVAAAFADRVAVLDLERNMGKAEAVRRGMLLAIERRFELVGYWDADLATPLNAINEFCRVLEAPEIDMVIGSRVRLLGRKIERRAARHYLGRVFATCASLLLGISVYDTQCGAKIFRNTEWLRKVWARPFKVRWTFDVEMLARFPIVMGVVPGEACRRWIEFPLHEWADVKGSKIRKGDFVQGGIEFCRLFLLLATPARKGYEKYLRQGP